MTVDCMACLVALARSKNSNAAWMGPDGVTHATYRHPSYREYQALTCTFREDGRVTLVPWKHEWSISRMRESTG